MNTSIFYKHITTVTRDRLGSTAERFVTRLIRSHLHKDPETLKPQDLERLIDWIELAMRTIYSDQRTIDAYIHDLQTLLPATTVNLNTHGK